MSIYTKPKTPLTEYDIENWWRFLMTEYPKNYECAKQYYSDVDSDLATINRTPGEFDVNDYFVICQLPKITAVKGIIRVDGRIIKRYDGFDEWKIKRIQFEKLKKYPIFEKWRKAQYYCQDKKCAWCERHISLYGYGTEVDHVKPLFYDGTNEFSNLVLACSDCNGHKGKKTEGYNSGMKYRVRNEVPRWIKHNYYKNFEIPHIEVTEQEIKEFDTRKNYKKNYDEDHDDLPL